MGWKHRIRQSVNWLGFDVVRLARSPKKTLLGVASLNIRTVIDVGANEGQFARMISPHFPGARLYCFEPLDEPFRKLAAWALTSGDRVRCFQVALGDREGEVEMYLHTEHTPSSSLLRTTEVSHRLYPQTRAQRKARVRMSTLDAVLGQARLEIHPDVLLKLDVQGFEDRVLRGAERTLGICRAVLIEVSLASLYEGQASFVTLAQMLESAGFRYAGNLDQVYADDGSVVFLDAVFLASWR